MDNAIERMSQVIESRRLNLSRTMIITNVAMPPIPDLPPVGMPYPTRRWWMRERTGPQVSPADYAAACAAEPPRKKPTKPQPKNCCRKKRRKH